MSTIGTKVSYQVSDLVGTPILRLYSQQVTTSYHLEQMCVRADDEGKQVGK